MKQPISLLLMVLFCAIMTACSGSDDSQEEETPQSTYQVPTQLSDGIEVVDGAELGMDTELLANIHEDILNEEFTNMHSVLVAKEGKLVYETYHSGINVYGQPINNTIFSRHTMQSITKSFTSALVGIALEQQGLTTETPLFDHFPEFDFSNDARKSAMTVGDALSMSGGLEWDEWTYAYTDDRNNNLMMLRSDDWVEFIANRRMAAAPGETFVYNSGLSVLLGDFVANVSNRNLGSFAQTNLFTPLGINDVDWYLGPNNVHQTGGGLSMSSRSLLKFGLLYQNGGVWNGVQVVPSEWVQISTRGQGANPTNYAYQWWRTTYNVGGRGLAAYFAAGYGGQYLIVVPQEELVVVFTAGNINNLGASQARAIMERYILRAVL